MVRIRSELILECGGRTRVYPLKSLLQNFGGMFAAMLGSPAYAALSEGGLKSSYTVRRLDGTSTTSYVEWYEGTTYFGSGTPLAMAASDNDDSIGIVVGSGSTSVGPTDYSLVSKIAHGTGSGQLDYDASAVLYSYGSSSSYVELYRSFTNKSGADITVREVGIIAKSVWRDSSAVRNDVNFLVARDVLPTPVKVPNLGTLTVRYRVSLSL
jgi:hypothetical protein